ncbi:DMT family transporter [Planctomycetes bacterium K23_9]|uniref:EamA-like transporter family protein n=1 Tax=Stieleria marina TaxID=1930275 RepID=A0A517NNI8_9BACT|nr:EamA-like transporter family protein [Planctomycetes bacterium K23_9]
MDRPSTPLTVSISEADPRDKTESGGQTNRGIADSDTVHSKSAAKDANEKGGDCQPTDSTSLKAPPSLRAPVGVVAAAAFGLASAVLYTASNIALRKSVGVDPFLVSAVKAAPTLVVMGPFLIWMIATHKTIATSYSIVPKFILVSLIGQFIGNAAFQVALGVIGLAASVPITLGTLIIGGAILGRFMLGEPVRIRTIIAMITLIGAVVILSMPGATNAPAESTSTLPLWVGAACAAGSGAAYALFGVVVRQALTGGMSAPAIMFLSGLVGTISLWAFCFTRMDIAAMMLIPAADWNMMIAAGIFNTIAFVALSTSLKALPVVAVNLINASQVAMAATAGVILFAEPITWPLLTGIALTFVGLAILASRKAKPASINAS